MSKSCLLEHCPWDQVVFVSPFRVISFPQTLRRLRWCCTRGEDGLPLVTLRLCLVSYNDVFCFTIIIPEILALLPISIIAFDLASTAVMFFRSRSVIPLFDQFWSILLGFFVYPFSLGAAPFLFARLLNIKRILWADTLITVSTTLASWVMVMGFLISTRNSLLSQDLKGLWIRSQKGAIARMAWHLYQFLCMLTGAVAVDRGFIVPIYFLWTLGRNSSGRSHCRKG